jgi:hypothetical protein
MLVNRGAKNFPSLMGVVGKPDRQEFSSGLEWSLQHENGHFKFHSLGRLAWVTGLSVLERGNFTMSFSFCE